LGIRPPPCERTIRRVLQRKRLGRAAGPLLPRQEYSGPQARAANELYEKGTG
jgi:hypothetical protein